MLNSEHCDHVLVSQKVCAGVYKGFTTSQLDELAAETAAAMNANHPDYASVANKLYAISYISGNIEQFATKMFLAAVDEHASDTGISKSVVVPKNRMDIEIDKECEGEQKLFEEYTRYI